MKKIAARISALLAPLCALTFAGLAHAQTSSLNDPLTFTNIQDFVAGILKILVVISLPIIGFFIVLVGFKFIWARGNSSALSDAKKQAIYVLVGAALVLGAWTLANLLGATVTQIVGS